MNEDTLYSVESGSPERVAAAIQKDCARLIALRTGVNWAVPLRGLCCCTPPAISGK